MSEAGGNAEPSGASGGSLLSMATDLTMSRPPFEFRARSAEWMQEYATHHAKKLQDGVGFFHLHEWLKERGVESQHRVIWAGWRNVRLWMVAHLLTWLFPHCKKRGMTHGFWE